MHFTIPVLLLAMKEDPKIEQGTYSMGCKPICFQQAWHETQIKEMGGHGRHRILSGIKVFAVCMQGGGWKFANYLHPASIARVGHPHKCRNVCNRLQSDCVYQCIDAVSVFGGRQQNECCGPFQCHTHLLFSEVDGNSFSIYD
ncbi:hypothetical protein CEXT_804961 [Caerostris extrusa]|uniref:Uncharacterized protein n=1 Tax=Caerostris extrusa TaxID=172846 RepID=A0AAV4MC49_CAEEX|nr:hypothetical protein CEXT_804961 [Caerostris extrusa]